MSLVSEVKTAKAERKLTLSSVPMHELELGNRHDPIEVRGRIAEKYVEMWLEACPSIRFDEELPRDANSYTLEKQKSGIVVFEHRNGKKESKAEFDFLIYYRRWPTLVQVRSGGINGLESKLDDYLALGREIYSKEDIRMLLFFPIYQNKWRDADRISAGHPNVSCVNIGYKKRSLNAAVKRYFAETGIQPLVITPK